MSTNAVQWMCLVYSNRSFLLSVSSTVLPLLWDRTDLRVQTHSLSLSCPVHNLFIQHELSAIFIKSLCCVCEWSVWLYPECLPAMWPSLCIMLQCGVIIEAIHMQSSPVHGDVCTIAPHSIPDTCTLLEEVHVYRASQLCAHLQVLYVTAAYCSNLHFLMLVPGPPDLQQLALVVFSFIK